jgi:hypothetical protein
MASDFVDELDELAKALRATLPDVEVEVEDPSIGPPGVFGLEVAEVLTVILPFAGEYLASKAIDIILGKLREARQKRQKAASSPRIVRIYGPNGEVLKTVEIDGGEAAVGEPQE